jgi:hypothetical protein
MAIMDIVFSANSTEGGRSAKKSNTSTSMSSARIISSNPISNLSMSFFIFTPFVFLFAFAFIYFCDGESSAAALCVSNAAAFVTCSETSRFLTQQSVGRSGNRPHLMINAVLRKQF